MKTLHCRSLGARASHFLQPVCHQESFKEDGMRFSSRPTSRILSSNYHRSPLSSTACIRGGWNFPYHITIMSLLPSPCGCGGHLGSRTRRSPLSSQESVREGLVGSLKVNLHPSNEVTILHQLHQRRPSGEPALSSLSGSNRAVFPIPSSTSTMSEKSY